MAADISYEMLKASTVHKLVNNHDILQHCVQFIFCDIINSRRIQDRIKNLQQLFDILEERDELSENYVTPIKKVAEIAEDAELYTLADNYEAAIGGKTENTCSICSERKFLKEEDISPPRQSNKRICSLPTVSTRSPSANHHSTDLSKVIQLLVDNLGRDWKDLARCLGIPEAEIEAIIIDYKYLKEQIFQMLNFWKKNQGEDATISILIHALQQSKRKDLVDQILRELKF